MVCGCSFACSSRFTKAGPLPYAVGVLLLRGASRRYRNSSSNWSTHHHQQIGVLVQSRLFVNIE